MIGLTLTEVRVIIDGTMTIVVENLLNPNLIGPFHTPSRGTTRPMSGLTPRLHVSPLTAHTLPPKTTEEKQATRRHSLVSNVTNRAITLPNAQLMIEEKHLP